MIFAPRNGSSHRAICREICREFNLIRLESAGIGCSSLSVGLYDDALHPHRKEAPQDHPPALDAPKSAAAIAAAPKISAFRTAQAALSNIKNNI